MSPKTVFICFDHKDRNIFSLMRDYLVYKENYLIWPESKSGTQIRFSDLQSQIDSSEYHFILMTPQSEKSLQISSSPFKDQVEYVLSKKSKIGLITYYPYSNQRSEANKSDDLSDKLSQKPQFALSLDVFFEASMSQITTALAREAKYWNEDNASIIEIQKSDEFQAYNYCFAGRLSSESKQYNDGIRFFTEAIKIDNKYVDAYAGRARIYFLQSNFSRALEDITAAIQKGTGVSKNIADLYQLRGEIYLEQNLLSEAIKDFDKVIYEKSRAIEPRLMRIEVYRQLAQIENNLRHWDDVINEYVDVLSIDPNNPKHLLERAKAYIATKNLDKAKEDLQIIVSNFQLQENSIFQETVTKAYLERAKLYLNEYSLEQAEEDIEHILQHIKNHPKAKILKGVLHRKKLEFQGKQYLEGTLPLGLNLYLQDFIDWHEGLLKQVNDVDDAYKLYELDLALNKLSLLENNVSKYLMGLRKFKFHTLITSAWIMDEQGSRSGDAGSRLTKIKDDLLKLEQTENGLSSSDRAHLLALCHIHLAGLFFTEGNIDAQTNEEEDVAYHLEKANRYTEEIDYNDVREVYLRYIWYNLFNIYLVRGDQEKIHEAFRMASKLARDENDKSREAYFLFLLGEWENRQNHLLSAKEHFLNAKRLAVATRENRTLRASLISLASISRKEGNYTQAHEELQKIDTKGDPFIVRWRAIAIGRTLLEKGELRESIDRYKNIEKDLRHPEMKRDAQINIALLEAKLQANSINSETVRQSYIEKLNAQTEDIDRVMRSNKEKGKLYKVDQQKLLGDLHISTDPRKSKDFYNTAKDQLNDMYYKTRYGEKLLDEINIAINNLPKGLLPYSDANNFYTILRQKMNNHLNMEDVRTIVFDMIIDFDNLKGTTKNEKIVSLLEYAGNHERVDELLIRLGRKVPKVNWK